jgi:hypothetical protein
MSFRAGSRVPRVHLTAVVGGGDSLLLTHLIEHYRGLGVESFYLTRHAESTKDPTYEEIEHYARAGGVNLFATYIGPWSHDLHGRLINVAMAENPDDWYVVADLDEFHVYDRPLIDLIEFCERSGYYHVNGCFLDRIAIDGGFPEVGTTSLWEQYPLGGAVTMRLLRAPTLKTGLALGRFHLGGGHHGVRGETGVPRNQSFIQVHHFKWTGSVVERIRTRVEEYESGAWRLAYPGVLHEARRFLNYLDHHNGRIDVTDESLYLYPCGSGYHDHILWNDVADQAEKWG